MSSPTFSSAAIDARRTIPFDRFVYALGIRHVGETTARLLARSYGRIEDFLAAMKEAAEAARASGSLPPRAYSVNAPTRLMRELGRADGYAYDHDAAHAFSGQDHFPEGLPRRAFYRPSDRGFEREIGRRLAHWAALREARG